MGRLLGGLLVCGGLAACAEEPARPQLLLYVDVDMPVPQQLGLTLSQDAAVDTIRMEIYRSDRTLIDARTFVVATPADLPLSLGIVREAVTDDRVAVRIRAFRALFSSPGELGGVPVLDPLPEVTVDRAVELGMPIDGVAVRSVTLHGECMGIPTRFGLAGSADRTCIDADHLDGSATDGIDEAAPAGSVAGGWPRALAVPCPQDAPAGLRCVPGGFTILGDPLFLATNELDYDAVPLHPTALSPFYLDETEVTVGELRGLVERGYDGPLPVGPDPTKDALAKCTWDAASPDSLPLNCLEYETADAICAARGGRVPSEAEWEHAARGRGERRMYPWGGGAPECCAMSIGRTSGGGCTGREPEPVSSHLGGEDCVGDVSRDGVLDLDGSVAELVLDSTSSFADSCWRPSGGSAILESPVCTGASNRIARGASWGMAFGDAPLPIRRVFIDLNDNYGVRCAYPELP